MGEGSKKKIVITGSNGLVGSAFVEKFSSNELYDVILCDKSKFNLLYSEKFDNLLQLESPNIIIHCAGIVGGISEHLEKNYEMLVHNTKLNINVIESAMKHGVEQLCMISSSAIYDKNSWNQNEDDAFSGKIDEVHLPYVISKLVGMNLCEIVSKKHGLNYFSVMPCSIYGSNNVRKNAGVLYSLMNRISEAKDLGAEYVHASNGHAIREFVHVNDVVSAVELLLKIGFKGRANIGSGMPISIENLAARIKKIIGYEGSVFWDNLLPCSSEKRCVDSSYIRKLGWEPLVTLDDGLRQLYANIRK